MDRITQNRIGEVFSWQIYTRNRFVFTLHIIDSRLDTRANTTSKEFLFSQLENSICAINNPYLGTSTTLINARIHVK